MVIHVFSLAFSFADISTIEFQKRGLPHAHILLFLDGLKTDLSPEVIDQIICAEIPNRDIDPDLFEIVTNCMIHGPCGHLKPNASCMVEKKMFKIFSKEICECDNCGSRRLSNV